MDTRKLSADAQLAAVRASTTHVTDVDTRNIRSDDLPWSPFHVIRHGERIEVRPDRATVTYHRSSSDGGPPQMVVTAHVSCRKVGRAGGPVGDYMSAEFDTDDPDVWPDWLRLWADLYHPDRGGPDNDPEGSYL